MIDAAFVFDIDGTLYLHREGAASQLAVLMQAIGERGARFAVATSRPLHDVLAIFRGSTLPYLAICNDGALSFRVGPDGATELLDSIPVSDVSVLAQSSFAAGDLAHPIIFTISADGEGPVMLPRAGVCLAASLVALTPGRDYRHCDKLSEALDACRTQGLQVRSLAYFVPNAEAARHAVSARTIAAALGNARVLSYVDTRVDDGYWHEVVNDALGKQTAISRLRRAALIPRWIIASGNAWNDLEMLAAADIAVVPLDAEQAALDVAQVVAGAAGGIGFVTWMLENHGTLLDESLRL